MLVSGQWREVDLRPYDVTAAPPSRSTRARSTPWSPSCSRPAGSSWRWASPRSSAPTWSRASGTSTRCFSPRTTRPGTCRTPSTSAGPARCRLPDDAAGGARAGGPTRTAATPARWAGATTGTGELAHRPVLRTHTTACDHPRPGRRPRAAAQGLLRRPGLPPRDRRLQAPAGLPPGGRHHHRRARQLRQPAGHAERLLPQDGLRALPVPAGLLPLHRAQRGGLRLGRRRSRTGSRWAARACSAPR